MRCNPAGVPLPPVPPLTVPYGAIQNPNDLRNRVWQDLESLLARRASQEQRTRGEPADLARDFVDRIASNPMGFVLTSLDRFILGDDGKKVVDAYQLTLMLAANAPRAQPQAQVQPQPQQSAQPPLPGWLAARLALVGGEPAKLDLLDCDPRDVMSLSDAQLHALATHAHLRATGLPLTVILPAWPADDLGVEDLGHSGGFDLQRRDREPDLPAIVNRLGRYLPAAAFSIRLLNDRTYSFEHNLLAISPPARLIVRLGDDEAHCLVRSGVEVIGQRTVKPRESGRAPSDKYTVRYDASASTQRFPMPLLNLTPASASTVETKRPN